MLVFVFRIRTTQTGGLVTTGGGGGASSGEQGPTSSMILQSVSERLGMKSSSCRFWMAQTSRRVAGWTVPVISRRMPTLYFLPHPQRSARRCVLFRMLTQRLTVGVAKSRIVSTKIFDGIYISLNNLKSKTQSRKSFIVVLKNYL